MIRLHSILALLLSGVLAGCAGKHEAHPAGAASQTPISVSVIETRR